MTDTKVNPSGRNFLNELASEIREVNKANGWNLFYEDEDWNKEYKVPAILCLIHSEVDEALQDYRMNKKPEMLIEMADVLIRVLDFVGGFKADFDKVVNDKIEYNKTRGYRHGGKRV
jgi:NTP pyrophosphatase (non-canonical NTP hydrolase)